MSSPSDVNPDLKQPKLLDQVRSAIRLRHYSIRTEEAYVQWMRLMGALYTACQNAKFLSRSAATSNVLVLMAGCEIWEHIRLSRAVCLSFI